MSTAASVPARERLSRAVLRLRERSRALARGGRDAVRLLFRRQTWTWEGVRAMGVRARRRPRRTALAALGVREQMAALGAEPAPMTPAQFRTLLEAEARLGGALVKALNIRVD